MKNITLTRNGQTAPRDVETSTMHADRREIPPEVVVCPQCGEAWTRTTTRKGRKCKSCRNARSRELRPSSAAAKTITLETIATAQRRPRGCSAVRWRCELRRRANPEYYREYGINV